MGEVTAKLAEFVSSVEFKDLPGAVVQKTKEVLLDSIGCALGAYVTNRAKIAVELSESLGTKPEATIIGYRKVSCPGASFVNGELINCMDFDEISVPGGHGAPYVLPSALAISEKEGRKGKDLLTALAIAHEVGARATASVCASKVPKKEPPYWEEAQRFSYTATIFGAVAGACKSLGLSNKGIRSAFGIGGTSTPLPGGMKWEYLTGPYVMNLKYGTWSGWIAMLGTVAGLAAQKGFTGDPDIHDGHYGFWQMYGSPFFDEDILLGGLGKVWYSERSNFKYYPCCYLDATSIAAIQRLVEENKIEAEDVDEIVVYGDPLMLLPNRWPADIKTNEDAQFVHRYLWALAVCRRDKPGPQWQLPSSLTDSRIKNLMPKVKAKVHPQAAQLVAEKFKTRTYPIFFNVIVEISARGRKFTTEEAVPRGHFSNPMSTAELIDKFKHNASYSLLKQSRMEPIIETIWKLDRLENVTELTRLLAIDS